MNTLFTNAVLLLPDGNTEEGCLGVAENKIAFVGQVPEGFEAHKVIDCGRNLLMPGLVNTHTHLPMTLFRSRADDLELSDWLQNHIWPMEDRYLNDDTVYWGSLLGLAEMIRGGTTCINDMYFFADSICEAAAQAGMRGLIGRCVVTGDDEGQSRIAESIDLFKKWDGAENGRIRCCFTPHAEYTCTPGVLQEVHELAEKYDTKYHIHVSETYSEHEECKGRHGGKTPVALLNSLNILDERCLLAHCVHADAEDIGLIAQSGATVLHCPQSNLKLGSGIAPLPLMLAARANVALGTDGAASNNNLDMFEELRLSATLHKGLTGNATVVNARQALYMATRGGAQALGFSSGALEAGRLADIILVDRHAPHMLPHTNDLSLAVYSAGASDVLLTMIDGRVLYERGEFYTLDLERIISEIQRINDTMGGL